MKYTVEDTQEGFRLTAQVPGEAGTKRVYDEIGGHGPVERLFMEAVSAWAEADERRRVEREA